MVFDEWQNGIPIAFMSLEKVESDLDLVLQALSKCMPNNWMPNVILVDNAQVEINVLKFDFLKCTYYNSMFINCVL